MRIGERNVGTFSGEGRYWREGSLAEAALTVKNIFELLEKFR
jgi:hypothetical protein